MLLRIDVAAGFIEILVQVFAFRGSELTISFVLTLFLPNTALLMFQLACFVARQLARSNALANARLLILLTRVDAWIAITRVRNRNSSEAQCGDHCGDGNAFHCCSFVPALAGFAVTMTTT